MSSFSPVFKPLLRRADQLNFRLALVFAVALLPLMIVSILRSQSVINEAEQRSQAALVGETLRAVQAEAALIERAKSSAQTLSILVPAALPDLARCNALMLRMIDATPFSFAGYYDLNGFVPCSSAARPFSFPASPEFEAQLANPGPVVLVNEAAPASRTSVIYASYPVFDDAGALQGFTAVSVPHAMLAANQRPDIGATFLTVKDDETILTAPGSPSMARGLLPVLAEGESFADLPSSFIGRSRDGEMRVYSVAPLVAQDVYALGTWTNVADFGSRFYLTHPAVFPILMWLASLGVAWFAARLFVTRHVVQLRAAMRSFSSRRAQPQAVAFHQAPGELRDVAEEFGLLTDRIVHEEARLEDVARQKDVLLHEVHHRVKNNLQLIASIMNMQMRQSPTPEVKEIIRSLHDRVNSLATVHRDLYQTSSQADVSMDELLRSIAAQVVRMGTSEGGVHLETELEAMRLSPDQAVPLSLFVTEALTNALKYLGAPQGAQPTLKLRLSHVGADDALIELSNSLPRVIETPDAEKSSGLGSDLMAAFGTQLGGELERVQDAEAFTVRLRFPIEGLAAKLPDKETAH